MISVNAKYWIWITQALGYNTNKINLLNELYPDISVFCLGGEREWRFSGIMSEKDIQKLKSTRLEVADKIAARCRELRYSIICIEDYDYPKCLKQIYASPAVIYVSGKLPDIDNRLTIGIVGTRTASRYGTSHAYKIAYALSKYGVCTISGGALGIDCASHRGALAADGVTVCVRGCGINCDYLKENEGMRRAITSRGTVISEYPPDERPRSYYFPARNRIIAALSNGVLIIESGERSGSLITANYALEMGKDVFALVGNSDPRNVGSNNRIKEGSAQPITDFMDILNAYDDLYITGDDVDFDGISLADIDAIPVKGRKIKVNQTVHSRKADFRLNGENTNNSKIEIKQTDKLNRKNLSLTGELKTVYEYLTDEPVHIDKIAADIGFPVYRVLTALTQLEMQGHVKALQGRRFCLK